MYSIHVQNLVKSFGTNTVLQSLSLTHEEGVLGIAGPNGSGKSTLLRCLSSLARPSSGTVTWRYGDRTLSQQEIRGVLGFLAPYINLYAELTVRENLRFVSRLRKLDISEATIDEQIERVGLAPFRDHLFGKLSTGQQQRAKLAAATIHAPSVLFLDEPGANLDEKGRSLIESLVEQFRDGASLAILASNNPQEIAWCDRVYSVESGRFIKPHPS